MENSSSGSFIPKRSTGKVAARRVGKRIYIFSYIAYTLFFGTLLSVVGIFLLNQQAEAQLESYIQKLAEERTKFNRGDMDRVIALSEQLAVAESVLNEHLAPSQIFDELEEVIVKTIQLSGIDYTKNSSGVKVVFKGSVDTFDALMFQREVMQASEVFDAAKVSGVTYGSESVEAVGSSARNPIASVTTDTTISFTFDDETVKNKIGYEPRESNASTTDTTATPADTTVSDTNTISP